MAISFERRARIGNGFLVLAACILGMRETTRTVGQVIVVLMGLGLMFSGITGFCGWIRIFSALRTFRQKQDPQP